MKMPSDMYSDPAAFARAYASEREYAQEPILVGGCGMVKHIVDGVPLVGGLQNITVKPYGFLDRIEIGFGHPLPNMDVRQPFSFWIGSPTNLVLVPIVRGLLNMADARL